MAEAVPVAEAMEQAREELAAEQWAESNRLADENAYERQERGDTDEAPVEGGPCWCGLTHAAGVTHAQPEDEPQPVEASVPVQVPLFEPPPFDFEEAYDELQRLDRRAQNRKSAWESLKGAASDAKKDYDSAIDDLHDKFDEIDSARRVAAAVHAAPKPTQEEVKPQMSESDMEQTIDVPLEPEPTPEEPSDDAPGD